MNKTVKQERCLSGFEVKHFPNWDAPYGDWRLIENRKKYIIFKFTDGKARFQSDCPGLKVRRLAQARANKMLVNNGQSLEKLAEIGNFPVWWNDVFAEQGGTP